MNRSKMFLLVDILSRAQELAPPSVIQENITSQRKLDVCLCDLMHIHWNNRLQEMKIRTHSVIHQKHHDPSIQRWVSKVFPLLVEHHDTINN